MNPVNTLPYTFLKINLNIILPTKLMPNASVFINTAPEVHGRLNPDHFYSFRFKFPHTVNSALYVCSEHLRWFRNALCKTQTICCTALAGELRGRDVTSTSSDVQERRNVASFRTSYGCLRSVLVELTETWITVTDF